MSFARGPDGGDGAGAVSETKNGITNGPRIDIVELGNRWAPEGNGAAGDVILRRAASLGVAVALGSAWLGLVALASACECEDHARTM